MRYLFFTLFVLLALPALAQETKNHPLPPECRVLPDHKARADVAYQPGVDVRGKAVVPADINAAPMDIPQTIVVPLTIDLAQRLQGMNVPGLKMDGTLGFLEVSKDGRVTYDGRDLTPQVYVLCGLAGPDILPKKAQEPGLAADRQSAPDVLESAPVKDMASPPQPMPVPPPAPASPVPAPEPGKILQGEDYSE